MLSKEQLEKYKEWELGALDKYGYFIHKVMPDDDVENINIVDWHTHGLFEKHQMSDIRVVYRVPDEVADRILSQLPTNMIYNQTRVWYGHKVYDEKGHYLGYFTNDGDDHYIRFIYVYKLSLEEIRDQIDAPPQRVPSGRFNPGSPVVQPIPHNITTDDEDDD